MKRFTKTINKGLKKKFFILLVLLGISFYSISQNNSALIGQNYWLTVDQVWGQVGTMKPEIIRVGGIGFNESYKGKTWYNTVLNNIENIGATPMVQISDQWQDAQVLELLQYFVDTKRKIDYFSIGNEPDHSARNDMKIPLIKNGQIQYDANGNPIMIVNTDKIIAYYNKLGPIIRKYYPNATLIGPCWANFYDGIITGDYFKFIDGTKNTKDAKGKNILNVFSFHSYASTFNSNKQAIYDLSTFEGRMNILLPKIAEVNATRNEGDKLSWALTEFHTTYNNIELQVGSGAKTKVPDTHKTYSFYAGQYFAQLYGYAMEKGAWAMMPWSIIEGETERNFGDLGIFDHDAKFSPRSTYYHTQMLTTNLKTNTIAHEQSQTDVELVAMQDASGIAVMVMNTGGNTYNLTLKLGNETTTTSNLIVKIKAGINKEIQDGIKPTSTKIFIFDGNGNLLKTTEYTSTIADNRGAPVTSAITKPIASFIVPLTGAILNEGQKLTIEVNADHSSGISNIQLFIDNSFLRQENQAPYQWGLTTSDPLLGSLSIGAHTLRALVTANNGSTTEIQTIVTIKALNKTPSITLIAPLNNTTFNAPANVTITANAADSDGTISKVEFYNGTTLLSSDATAPYSFSWSNVPAGNYEITSKAFDNANATATSIVSKIIVSAPANNVPTLTLISPLNNTAFISPANVTITANAEDSDGTISKVEFYNGTTLLSSDATAPYSFSWSNVPTGTYEIIAKAFDNSNASATSTLVNIVVSGIITTNGIHGNTCISKGQTYKYTLQETLSVSLISWWNNIGATLVVTPGNPKEVSLTLPDYFSGSSFQLYSGTNYSVSPWYKEYSVTINVGNCTSGNTSFRTSASPLPFESSTLVSTYNNETIENIEIYNSQGNLIKVLKSIDTDSIELGEELPKGLYILNISGNTGNTIMKIVKGY